LKKVIIKQSIKVKNQAGVAIIEFALIGLLVFALSFGIITFGIALYDYAVITNASREGARSSVVAPVSARGYSSGTTTCTPTTLSSVAFYSININTPADSEYTGRCVALSYLGSNLINLNGSATPLLTQISAVSKDSITTNACSVPTPTCSIKVTVSVPFNGVWFLKAMNLTAQTTMYYE
jgi:Flp pilus assembly protein TadG